MSVDRRIVRVGIAQVAMQVLAALLFVHFAKISFLGGLGNPTIRTYADLAIWYALPLGILWLAMTALGPRAKSRTSLAVAIGVALITGVACLSQDFMLFLFTSEAHWLQESGHVDAYMYRTEVFYIIICALVLVVQAVLSAYMIQLFADARRCLINESS